MPVGVGGLHGNADCAEEARSIALPEPGREAAGGTPIPVGSAGCADAARSIPLPEPGRAARPGCCCASLSYAGGGRRLGSCFRSRGTTMVSRRAALDCGAPAWQAMDWM